MKKLLYSIIGIILMVGLEGAISFSSIDNCAARARELSAQAHDLDPKVVELALRAYEKVSEEGLAKKPILTVVDYSKPSTAPRFWVINLRSNRVLYEELVSHGRGSGDNYATSFSNAGQSHKSSIGVYVTRAPYEGHHGLSLRLEGLDHGFNDRAESRAVVVHGAPYADASFAREHGRLGLSWGCFALSPRVVGDVIHTIQDGTVLFAYYPDHRWLSQSPFLRA